MLSREQYGLRPRPENNRKSSQKPFLRYCKLCFGAKKCIICLIFLFSNIIQQVITYLGNIIVKRALVLSEADRVMMLTQKALCHVVKGYCDFIPVDLFLLSSYFKAYNVENENHNVQM